MILTGAGFGRAKKKGGAQSGPSLVLELGN
jgi:hypothetical protein